MKYCKIVCSVSVVVLFIAVCGLLLYHGDDGEESENMALPDIQQPSSDARISSGNVQAELYERLYSFAQVLYQYDTDERMFYDGAEEYMTPEAYQVLYPGVVDEAGDPQRIHMQSRLMGVNVYAFYKEETGVDVIMESQFTLSHGTNGSLTQYLKLSLEKLDGLWMITECSVIDTIEE